MRDLIDRQAAIDVATSSTMEWDGMYVQDLNVRIREAIEQLPSAQPEIIRCKDCIMHGLCRFEQGLGLDGYCSQAERRIDG